MPPRFPVCLALLAFTFSPAGMPRCAAQAPTAPAPATTARSGDQEKWQAEQARINAGNAADYADMLHQLGLEASQIRPGVDGYGKGPHPVNYDESTVPSITLPDPLVLTDGKPVRSAADWWSKRRPELVHLLEDSMYGRVPDHTPGVSWTVVSSTNSSENGIEAITRTVRGHVDNRAAPAISVDIEVKLTLPRQTAGKVPVMIAFDWPPEFWADFAKRTGHSLPVPPGPTAKEQLLAKGWGYALLVPTSVQADNGAGLTAGIIGLTNHGARRTPEQWGALRAWGWGASRLLDYFETQTNIDSHRVGVFGHSRYGKAALVAMAFDSRFAMGYISSSGEVGAKLSRRQYGELVENIAADGEYHWMAGNFLRYASTKTANDLPVDAHDLIALCAPRAVFLSAGTRPAGDGWVDARGIFLAGVAAGPVYSLLGASPMVAAGTQNPAFPAVLTEVGSGPIAFRQHDQGHTPAPNWPSFLTFAQRELFGPDFPMNLKAQ